MQQFYKDFQGNIVSESDCGDGSIDYSNATVTEIASGLNYALGIGVESDDTVYVADTYNSRILKIEPNDTQTVINTRQPQDVEVHPNGAVLFNHGTTIKKINSDNSTEDFLTLNSNSGNRLSFDSTGNLYTASSHAVKKFDSSGSLIGTLKDDNWKTGTAIDNDGFLYTSENHENKVYKLDPDTGNVLATYTGFNQPRGITFDELNNMYVCNFGGGEIIKQSPDGTQTIVVQNVQTPIEIEINRSSGIMYVIAWSKAYKIDPN